MLNVVALMGRLTADPELRHTQNGTAVISFSLAVNRNYVKQGENQQTDFIDITAWRATAEFVAKYFHKGQLVAVNGSIRTRTYQDKNGNNRKAVEVLADNVHFAEAKRDSYVNNRSDNFEAGQRAYQEEDNTSFANGVPSDFEDVISDDDLPF